MGVIKSGSILLILTPESIFLLFIFGKTGFLIKQLLKTFDKPS